VYLFLIYAQAFMVNKYTLTPALFDTGLDGAQVAHDNASVRYCELRRS
jgi:hypothetical protein